MQWLSKWKTVVVRGFIKYSCMINNTVKTVLSIFKNRWACFLKILINGIGVLSKVFCNFSRKSS